jgi:hypothetical protein
MKLVEKDGKFYRMRRGKLVEIPPEWVGKTVHPQEIRGRKEEAKSAHDRIHRARANRSHDAIVNGLDVQKQGMNKPVNVPNRSYKHPGARGREKECAHCKGHGDVIVHHAFEVRERYWDERNVRPHCGGTRRSTLGERKEGNPARL